MRFDFIYIYIWTKRHTMTFKEGEEVPALGGGGNGGAVALEGGEVGEGTVYKPQGAAAWALYATRKLCGQV